MKTDGTYIYTYSEDSREIRIVRASDLALQKTIKLPENFSSLQMYLSAGKLVVVGQKYVTTGNAYSARWYAPESKSIVAVYRITDPSAPVLERYNQIDGNYRDSRIVDGVLYLVSTSDLRIPPLYMTQYQKKSSGFADAIAAVEKNFSLKRLAPEIRESYLSTR